MQNYNLMDSFKELLSIESVKSEPTQNAPFGENVKKALLFTLDLAQKMGFETKNYDNYIGEIIFGEGKPFGILCHLDVVPSGNLKLWNTPPFTPTEKDGNLYARGVLDDKCGAICSLFALYKLKQEGYLPKRQIKIILGCDEESGWGCIEHYKKVSTLPEEGFSPDANFPVIYAEKGILHIKYRFRKLKNFELQAGDRANVVCDYCKFKALENNDLALAQSLSLKANGESLESFGRAGHASTPDKGVNALHKPIEYLCKLGYLDEKIHKDLFHDAQGLNQVIDETGNLTFSPDVAYTDNEYLYVTTDIRYPSTLEYEYVLKLLSKITPDYEVLNYQKPLFVDKNSTLVQTLLGVYNEVTGENAQPIAIGGGTYARAIENGVAFGPAFGEEEDYIHQPNEYMPIENINKFFDILYKALLKLCF